MALINTNIGTLIANFATSINLNLVTILTFLSVRALFYHLVLKQMIPIRTISLTKNVICVYDIGLIIALNLWTLLFYWKIMLKVGKKLHNDNLAGDDSDCIPVIDPLFN